MKRLMIGLSLFISTFVYADGRYYMVTLGYTSDGGGGSIGHVIWADSEIMACNMALQKFKGMYCWGVKPQ